MKKLTFEQFRDIYNNSASCRDLFNTLLTYLADEQPAEHPTKPEPSRLEVAAMIYAHGSMTAGEAVTQADELIKQSKQTP